MAGRLACSRVSHLHKGQNRDYKRATTNEDCWNSELLAFVGLLLRCRWPSYRQAEESRDRVRDNVYRPQLHCVSLWLQRWVIWDWRLCLLRSQRAVSHVTDYLCQSRKRQVPPRWVGFELVLSEVNNRVFRPLCLSVPYSQTFSVKTV